MQKQYYAVWSNYNQKYLRGCNKDNYLYESVKGCKVLIRSYINRAKKYSYYPDTLTKEDNYEIRKFELTEIE